MNFPNGDPQFSSMMTTLTPQQQQMYLRQMQMQGPYASTYGGGPMGMPNYPGMQNMYGGTSMYNAPATASAPRPAEATPSPPKKEKLRVKLKPEERGVYSSLFDVACPKGGSKIEGREAAGFLKGSNLPKELLKQIWETAAQTNSMSLTRDEFYVALRLVALAQAGKEATAQAIIVDIDAPLPKFKAIPSQSSNTGGSYGASYESPQTSPYMQPGSSDESKYSPTDDEIQKYLGIYNNVDTEQKGYLDSEQMKVVLGKTHLPGNVANTLWMVCDEKGTGNFPRNVAIMMIHLAVLAIKKVPLPRSIPPELRRKVTSALGNAPPPRPAMESRKPMDNGGGNNDGFMGGFSGPKPSHDAQARSQSNAKSYSGQATGEDTSAILRKEVGELRVEVGELREEDAETKEKAESMQERNKVLGAQLQKMKDELATLKKNISAHRASGPVLDGHPADGRPADGRSAYPSPNPAPVSRPTPRPQPALNPRFEEQQTAPPAYQPTATAPPAYQPTAPPAYQQTAPPAYQQTAPPAYQQTAPPAYQQRPSPARAPNMGPSARPAFQPSPGYGRPEEKSSTGFDFGNGASDFGNAGKKEAKTGEWVAFDFSQQ